MRTLSLLVAALAVLATGCVTAGPTSFDLPKERTNDCVQACQKLDLQMTAVVIMANSVGCVCEPKGSSTPTTQKAASAAAGGTVVLEQQQAAARAQAAQHH